MNKRLKQLVALTTISAMLVGCGKDTAEQAKEARESLKTDFSVNYDGIKTGTVDAGVSVHDPSIMEADGKYYIYGSHMSAAVSKDLRTWDYMINRDTLITSNGYDSANPVYGKIYDLKKGPFSFTGKNSSVVATDGDGGVRLWAPDVKYSKKKGLYYMYFCTSSTFNTSTLAYATSKSPEGPFEWKGNLIYSGFNENNIDKTNVAKYKDKDTALKEYTDGGISYNYQDYPNALDPTIFWDKDDRMWMVYGSWSGGIYLLEIDEETGEVIHPKEDKSAGVDAYFGKRLLGGGHTSIEGPYILYDKDSDYYYLFVSYGNLQREGGYQMRVFRSKTVDGEYVDMNGKYPQKRAGNPAYFGLKLSGNYRLPSLPQAYRATGHNSAFISSDDKRYIVYHTRFENRGETHEPRVHQYLINEEGWPCMLPYATGGETASKSGYDKSSIVGEYYVVNQGNKIDKSIAEPEKWVFTEDGFVFGQGMDGTWEAKDGTYYVHIKTALPSEDGTVDAADSYSGVFCKMKDEAGTDVMTFSAVGNNESIWGVKYNGK